MPAFNHVVTKTQTGAVSSDQVRSMLKDVVWAVRGLRKEKQACNNTLLLYFQGEELRSDTGQVCLMTSDASPERAFSNNKVLITSELLGALCLRWTGNRIGRHRITSESGGYVCSGGPRHAQTPGRVNVHPSVQQGARPNSGRRCVLREGTL